MEKQKISSYQDLIVWQKAKDFVVLVYRATSTFPQVELYGLTSQLRRAAVSVPSNIAEGFRRSGKKEKVQFLRVAYGSGAELETQLIIAHELGYLIVGDYTKLATALAEVMKMLNTVIGQFEQRR